MTFTVSNCLVRSPQLRFLARFTQQQLLHDRELDLESKPSSVSLRFLTTSSKSVLIADVAAGAQSGSVAVVATHSPSSALLKLLLIAS